MSDSIRIDWDQYFAGIANAVSSRATCPRRNVGAVLVKDKRIVATGYNGAPSGAPQCDEVGCLMKNDHCVRTIHAEPNLFLQADPRDTKGSYLYLTDFPCWNCALLIVNAGVRIVYVNRDYRNGTDVADFLADAYIPIIKMPEQIVLNSGEENDK